MATTANNPVYELKALKSRVTDIHATALMEKRDLTLSESEELEATIERANTLKAAIDRGQRNAEFIDGNGTPDASLAAGDWDAGLNGRKAPDAPAPKAKGFLTIDRVKANATAQVESGIKAFVDGGSQVTPIAFSPTPEPLARPTADLALVNVLPAIRRDNEEYTVVVQTARDNNAAVVPVGQLKPTSVFTVGNRSGKLSRLAHLSEFVDSYLLADNVELESFLTAEMTAGLWTKLNELGVTTFQTTSGIRTQAFQDSIMDSVFLALSDSQGLGYAPDVLLLSRADYNTIMLAKDTAGNYLYRNPADSRINGLAPVIVDGLTAKTALVVDSSRVNISLDKKGVLTRWDALTRLDYNETRVLVETRAAVDVTVPASIVQVATAAV